MLEKCLLLLLLLGTLTACVTAPEPVSPTTAAPAMIDVSISTSPTIVPATLTPVPSPSFTPTLLPTRTATRRPTIASTPTIIRPTRTSIIRPTSIPVVAAPPGLIYSDGTAMQIIEANGRADVIAKANMNISPDGQWGIYRDCGCDGKEILKNLATGYTRTLQYDSWSVTWSPDSHNLYYALRDKNGLADIWVEEAATGQRRNLTNTPDRYEDPPLAWLQNPGVLVFYSTPGIPDGAGYIGELTIMRTDGSGYQVVSQRDVSSPAAFSPDGRTIAYVTYEDTTSMPWYYRVGAQSQRFPWENFGLAKFKTMGFSSPSWSPDGQKIAWWMWSDDENHKETFGGIGLFNLELGTAALLNNFTEVIFDGWPDAVKWSPDGKRIAFFGGRRQSERFGDLGEFGIWTATADGSRLRRLIDLKIRYNVCDWAWQPDGQWLAISCREHQEILSGIWLAELETGKLLKTNLPDNAQVRGWVNPQP